MSEPRLTRPPSDAKAYERQLYSDLVQELRRRTADYDRLLAKVIELCVAAGIDPP